MHPAPPRWEAERIWEPALPEYAGKILGIGVGVPGLISVETGKIILSPAIGWHEGNFLVPLKERFRLPV